jgi:hypothetical protein
MLRIDAKWRQSVVTLSITPFVPKPRGTALARLDGMPRFRARLHGGFGADMGRRKNLRLRTRKRKMQKQNAPGR